MEPWGFAVVQVLALSLVALGGYLWARRDGLARSEQEHRWLAFLVGLGISGVLVGTSNVLFALLDLASKPAAALEQALWACVGALGAALWIWAAAKRRLLREAAARR